jgi:mRNA interferase MazF
MERFIKGDVVVVPFPFSDLTAAKRRPALGVAELSGDDLMLCQITGHKIMDPYSIELNDNDFESGNLNKIRISDPIVFLLPTRRFYSIKLVISKKKRLQKL